MSNFDVALLPALPDGGAGVVSSGAFGGSPGEAPPDAFAQLLEELAGEAPQAFMGLTKPPLSGVSVGDAELETVAISTSADGWEPGESGTVPDSTSDDQDQDALALVVLTATIAPSVLPEASGGSLEPKAGIFHTGAGTEQVPVMTGETLDMSELAVTTRRPGEAETPFELPAGRGNRETAGKPEGQTGEALAGRDASAANDAARNIDTERARIAAIENASPHIRAEGNVTGAESGAGRARGANASHTDRTSFTESRTPPATPPVAAAESSGDAGRRQGSHGEQQSGLAARAYEGIGAEPSGQSVSVGQAFSQAVTAAAQSAGPVTAAGGVVSGEANALESQIVQGMQRLRKDGAEEIRVTLRPEYLGALTISLRVEGDSVTAVMHVDEPQVRAWVQAHESQLRQAMSNQGLTLERLVVTDERPGSDNRERDDQTRQGRRPNRQRQAEDPTPNFEVVA